MYEKLQFIPIFILKMRENERCKLNIVVLSRGKLNFTLKKKKHSKICKKKLLIAVGP